MALLTPPPAAPQRGDRTTFANRVDAFITWLINFVSELLSLVANLNSIAAGGAYAIPYSFGTGGTLGSAAGGWIAVSDFSNQTGTPYFLADFKDGSGKNVSAQLAQSGASSSAVKATARLQKVGDPSKYMILNVTSYGGTSWGALFGTVIEASSTNPFAYGDAVILYIQRTGDKGDAGPPGSLPSIYVRQELAAGTSAEALASGAWTARNLNTTKWNDISGASVSSSVVTLPAGGYEVEISAPATSTNGHKVRLYNVTDGVVADVGAAAYALSTGGMSRSHLRMRFTITSPKAYRIDHFASTGATMAGAGGASIEVYSEFKATKIA